MIPKGIHADKKAIVAIPHELPVGRESLQWRALENATVATFQVIENAALEDKETCTNPAIGAYFLGET